MVPGSVKRLHRRIPVSCMLYMITFVDNTPDRDVEPARSFVEPVRILAD